MKNPDNDFSPDTVTCKCCFSLANVFSPVILVCNCSSTISCVQFYLVLVAVRRKYDNERRLLKDAEKGDEFRCRRVKKAKYEQRKQ